jgi:hypothetical protein
MIDRYYSNSNAPMMLRGDLIGAHFLTRNSGSTMYKAGSVRELRQPVPKKP